MVMFGVFPSRPETGYGYLELADHKLDRTGSANIKSFIEKPDIAAAKRMLDCERYLWNSGIFLFKGFNIIEAFKKYAPKTLEHKKGCRGSNKRSRLFATETRTLERN